MVALIELISYTESLKGRVGVPGGPAGSLMTVPLGRSGEMSRFASRTPSRSNAKATGQPGPTSHDDSGGGAFVGGGTWS